MDPKIETSIVIPTSGKPDLINSCLDSILSNTSADRLNTTEIIVVCNGERFLHMSLSEKYGNNKHVKFIFFPEMIGYTKATNIGISFSSGERIVLMNDDCSILGYDQKDAWLELLERPFKNSDKVGITGVKKLYSKETKRDFMVFFLVMIRKSLFDEIGTLDEVFNPGGGEDIDFCARAEKAGYRLVCVPKDQDGTATTTEYPCWHQAEKTVHTLPGWEDMFQQRMKILEQRNSRHSYHNYADVTAYMSTKGRYESTLPLAITAIANQTLRPKKFVLFQDDPDSFDLRTSAIYHNLFLMLQEKSIEWTVVFGEGKGQVLNHQKMLESADTEWIWRIDDDNIPNPDVLDKLCSHIAEDVAAIGGCVLDPGRNFQEDLASTQIEHVKFAINRQWVKGGEAVLADHLYSTFMYRRSAGLEAGGYCMELSPVGHREETMFTYEMTRKGHKCLIVPEAITWHLRSPNGGIRSYNDHTMWEHDERIFEKKLKEWGVDTMQISWVNMDCGIGDHWMFKPILNKMLEKVKGKKHIIACASSYPEVLSIKHPNLKMFSIEEGRTMLGKEAFDGLNIYKFCMDNNWKEHMSKAFERMYLNE